MQEATSLEVGRKSSQYEQICCAVASGVNYMYFDITREDAFELARILGQPCTMPYILQKVCFASRQGDNYTVSFLEDNADNRHSGIAELITIENCSYPSTVFNPVYLSRRLSEEMCDKIMDILMRDSDHTTDSKCSKKDSVDLMDGSKKRTDDNLRSVFG